MTTAEIINNMKTHISNAYDTVESKGGKLKNKNQIDNSNYVSGSLNASGNIDGWTFFHSTENYIKVNPNSNYILTLETLSSLNNFPSIICLYDENKTFLGNRLYNENKKVVDIQTTIDTEYIRVSTHSEEFEATLIEVFNKNLQNLSSAIESIDTPSNYLNFDLFNTSSNPKGYGVFTKLKLDCSNRTTLASACGAYINLEELEFTNTDNITSVATMCDGCKSLKKLVFGNADNLIACTAMYNNASNLEEVYGFKNYGKGFTEQTTNYNNYKLSFSRSTKLTYDSLINIINNLYDLNLTYDVANGGTLYSQVIDFGSTNLAKLTDEEKAIATSKGWTLS